MFTTYVRECLWKNCPFHNQQVVGYHPFDVPDMHKQCAEEAKEYWKDNAHQGDKPEVRVPLAVAMRRILATA